MAGMNSPRTAPADSCSLLNTEPLPGTAATERLWVCLEHPGNWGHDILDGTTFGEELSAALGEKMKVAGARLLLIRRPGRAGRILVDAPRTILVGVTEPGAEKLYRLQVTAPEDVLKLPLENPADLAQHGAVEVAGPVALACAHSKRDRCCAVFGRPIAANLVEAYGAGAAWECSHTGGHRFAPVTIFLPTGYTYGRLTTASVQAAFESLRDTGVPVLEGLRGRSCYEAPKQVAELAVRELLAESSELPGVGNLNVSRETLENNSYSSISTENLTLSHINHTDGRAWAALTLTEKLAEIYASCGKAPKPGKSVKLVSLEEITGQP